MSGSKGRFGKKTAVGAGIFVIAAIYLGALFKGFGLGSGSGDGDGEAPVKQEAPEQVSVEQLGDVVAVLIDGGNYGVLRTADANPDDKSNYIGMSLEKIVAAAKQVEGDSGIKVRIRRRSNAEANAENKLSTALLDSGFDRTHVYWVENTVP